MATTIRVRRQLLIGAILVATLTACGGSGSDDGADDAASAATATTVAPADTESDGGSDVSPDPVAVEACLENAGLDVRNQDEVDMPYSQEELDFFELETALLVQGGDTEFISGSIDFYRTIERAEAQQVNFEESITDYTVGRTGTAVYTLVGGTPGGELDEFVATIDRCLAGG